MLDLPSIGIIISKQRTTKALIRLRRLICAFVVRVAERLAPPTSDHGVAGSNPAGGEILP